MSEAIRGREKALGLTAASAAPLVRKLPTIPERFAELVRLAGLAGVVEPQSATWQAVQAWAGTRILEMMTAQIGAGAEKHAALSEKIKVLQELLELPSTQKEIVFADQGQRMP